MSICFYGGLLLWRDVFGRPSHPAGKRAGCGGAVAPAGDGPMSRLWGAGLILLMLVGIGLPGPAVAEADAVRIAQPYGLVYLPSYVAVDRGLIEKHAAAAGLGKVTVSLTRLASGPAGSDMLLAGDADLAMGGFGPALTLWDRTRGAQKVKAMMPLCSSPIFLVSSDPRIHTLRDFTDNDRIAVSAIKVTDQAITLQMAAAQEWGWEQRFRLDPLTVAMSNPDGLAAILGGLSEVRNHATIIPFAVTELESGKAHLVMTSDEFLEPGSSSVLTYATARFHDGSPKLYAATVAAFEEAIAFINAHPHEAAEIYVAREPQKRELGWVEAMITDPKKIVYSATPRGLKQHADFMHRVGTLRTQADSWRDLFWDNMADKAGS
jgi:NitT/TauT family transport system substrate-binding protein